MIAAVVVMVGAATLYVALTAPGGSILAAAPDFTGTTRSPTAGQQSVALDASVFIDSTTSIDAPSLIGGAVPSYAQQAQGQASDAEASSIFGTSSSMSSDGTYAIVGSPSKTVGVNANQGAAYVFLRSGTSWTQQAQLTASDGAASDVFGSSVALSADGNFAIVGAYTKQVGANAGQGAAYVFARSGATWTQQAKLTASDGAASDQLGWSVALSGDGTYAVVGAIYDDVSGRADQGSAYVFTRSGATWTQQAQLTASDGAVQDFFGRSVSLSSAGDYALVGAQLDNVGANSDQGSAYVFTRSGATWTQQAQLTASDGATDDYFGFSSSLSSDGNYAIVGAYLHGVGANADQGAAYVYTRYGTTWTQQAQLVETSGAATGYFGYSVAIEPVSGTYALIGAQNESGGRGQAYTFTRSGVTWTQRSQLTASDGSGDDKFGSSAALSSGGTYALVGAPYDNTSAGSDAGSTYVFLDSSSGATPVSVLLQTNTGNTQGGAATGSNLCTGVSLAASGAGTTNARITCTHGNLTSGTWYTLTMVSGANGIKSTAGDTMSSNVTVTFQSIFLTLSTTSIANHATGVTTDATVTADFDAALARANLGAWGTLTSGVSTHLNAVTFPSLDVGYAVGNSGVIRKTTNGGTSWSVLTSGTTHDLTDIHCVSTTACFAVGSASGNTSVIILKTTDGTTWTATTPSTGTALSGLDGVSCYDANTCWAFGGKADAGLANPSGIVFKTTNGGTSWTLLATNANGLPSSTALDGYFVGDQVGFAVENSGAIRKTTDGGTTWTSQTSGTSQNLGEVRCASATLCIAVGAGTTVLRTTNGGTSWTAITTSGSQTYTRVQFVGGGRVYLTGSTTRVSDDDGLTWSDQSIGTNEYIKGMSFPEALTGVLVGENGAMTKHTGNIRLQANTGNTQGGAPTGSNLCTSLTIGSDGSGNSNRRVTCGYSALTDSAWYTLSIISGSSGMQSTGGLILSADVTHAFQTAAATVVTDTTPPGNPTALTGTPTATQVTLTWTDPMDTDLTNLRIIRATGDSPATMLLGTVGKGIQRYVDSTITASTTYTYTVESVDQTGNRSSGTSVTTIVPASTMTVTSPSTTTTTSTTTGTTSSTTSTPTDHGTTAPPPGDTAGLLGDTHVGAPTPSPETTPSTTTTHPPITGDLLPGIPSDEPLPPVKPPKTVPPKVIGAPPPPLTILPDPPCALTSTERVYLEDAFEASQERDPGEIAKSGKKFTPKEDLAFLCALRTDPTNPVDPTKAFPRYRNLTLEQLAIKNFVNFFGHPPSRTPDRAPAPQDLVDKHWWAVKYMAYHLRLLPTARDVTGERTCLKLFLERDVDLYKASGVKVRKPAGSPPTDRWDYDFIRACTYSGVGFGG